MAAESKVEETKAEAESEEMGEAAVRKVPYKFSFKAFLIELVVAYVVTFSILYFIRLANFPYFELILTIAFTASIAPWKSSNLLLLIAVPITFANYFLGLSFFTYPSIVICYYAVLSFNERFKAKQLFVMALVFAIIYGVIVLPAIYRSLQTKVAYFYVFPVLMFLLRSVLSYCYWVIGHTAVIFLQLPLFLAGLEYGTILTRDISTIEFWFMMVFFSLQIINDRTQFSLRIMVNIAEYCARSRKDGKQLKLKEQQHPILPAHANGHAALNSFHLFLLVYVYAGLNLFTAPYSQDTSLAIYINPWYKPVVVWLLSSVYEIMSLVLEKQAKHKILFGHTSNKWWRSVLRGFVLSLGMWVFYVGLGVGAIIAQP